MKSIKLALAILLFSTPAFGQGVEKPFVGTFANVGVMHGQGSISSVHFSVSGIGVEVEKYFAKNRLEISGWEAGYWKQNFGLPSSGHLLSAKVFRLTKVGKLTMKSAVGIKAGLASGSFDRTEWQIDGSYIHLSERRNWNVPFLSEGTYGKVRPTIEVGLLSRKGPFLFEAGLAFDILTFGVDVWKHTPDGYNTKMRNRTLPIPHVFFSVGIPTKMFF